MTDMAKFAAYDAAGRILFVVSCSDDMAELNMRINGFTQFAKAPLQVRSDEYYMPEGILKQRPKMATELNGNTLAGVLAGATVTIEGHDYAADGTDVELEFTSAGEHLVKVILWPYQDQEFKVENPA
ncbi:hypothetical protein [Pseudomonas sp. LP_7_YM]|uniref:hypothetical protein n=1 Tax=Pseudomonas sp. LP_7_YM TaxID=2485137 RepID=UPI00105C2491|nr:hypothetical protein [Pseudomonas sp. LP_7_YM]TDV70202.1 hypothetical protein EC915_102467 [Pseudomonas sp. LP_7_YM]